MTLIGFSGTRRLHWTIPTTSLAFAYIVQVSFHLLSSTCLHVLSVLFKLTNHRSFSYPFGIRILSTEYSVLFISKLICFIFFILLPKISSNKCNVSSWRSIPAMYFIPAYKLGEVEPFSRRIAICKRPTDLFPIMSPRWAESRVNVL